jgi:hypothetical protein
MKRLRSFAWLIVPAILIGLLGMTIWQQMAIRELRSDIATLEWQQQALAGPVEVCDGTIGYPPEPCVAEEDIRKAVRGY